MCERVDWFYLWLSQVTQKSSPHKIKQVVKNTMTLLTSIDE